MALYIVEIPGFAKLGYSRNANQRLRQYSDNNPHVLSFAAVFDGERGDERALHLEIEREFKRHGRTEWFIDATAADLVRIVSEKLEDARERWRAKKEERAEIRLREQRERNAAARRAKAAAEQSKASTPKRRPRLSTPRAAYSYALQRRTDQCGRIHLPIIDDGELADVLLSDDEFPGASTLDPLFTRFFPTCACDRRARARRAAP